MSTKPGINRVTAWIYGVINPLEEVLEREAKNGQMSVAGYHWRGEGVESILYLRQYFTRAGTVLLDDLASYYEPIKQMERDHDALVPVITTRAKSLFDSLVTNEAFRAFVEANFQKVSDPKTMVQDVASDLVNDDPENSDAEPDSYGGVWARHLDQLKKFREVAGWKPLHSSLKKLQSQSDEMREALLKLRTHLAVEFDVPPAPLNT